ncbi:MAG: multicopper oxidase domain-containing protein [Kineosporiaceae bacterium]
MTVVALSRRGSGSARAAQPATAQLSGAQLVSSLNQTPDVHLAATDGWVNIARPGSPTDAWMKDIAPFWPDPLGASHDGGNLYVFGFRNVTGLSDANVSAIRGQAQISAPQLVFDQVPGNAPRDVGYRVKLSNLGLSQRPDLTDGHTIHWHGFVNAIPLFDGVPELSLSVPIGRSFTYFYRPYDAGTYMYHCHFEDVEHVQMGMTGVLFVRPLQNGNTSLYPTGRFAYNDGDGSTGYDREFGMMLTEIFAEGHYRDAHIQTTDWTDFKASFWCLNGRTYPDTIQPNAPWADVPPSDGTARSRGFDPNAPTGVTANDGTTSLRYQPQSSLVTANAGERVLLRLANLGYQNHAMTVDGVDLKIVAKDASLLTVGGLVTEGGRPRPITTNTVDIGPGESRDVIFTAPAHSGGTGPDVYLLYDRDYAYASNAGQPGVSGGMQTEIWVYPSGSLATQVHPNEQSAQA